MRTGAWLSILLLCGGCDVLFPEFAGSPTSVDMSVPADAGSLDGGGPSRVAGSLCLLRDLRDYRSCSPGIGAGVRVTVEETGDAAVADAQGAFVVALSKATSSATLATYDPSGAFAPSISTVRLVNGVVDNFGLPLVEAQTMQELALENGFTFDPSRGGVVAYVVDQTGAPVAGVTLAGARADGPFYDGTATNEVTPRAPTGAHGMAALFDLSAPTAQITLTPSVGAAVQGDQFIVPIRPGAFTLTSLVLAPK